MDLSYTAHSTQQLGLSLMGELMAVNQGNICISPLSICLCLQLALYGARANTAVEMLKVLGVTAANRDVLAEDAESLMKSLQMVPEFVRFEGPGASVQLALANSLWVHQAVHLRSDYAEVLRVKYNAICASLDFANPQSVEAINSWVDRATSYKIPQIIDQITPGNLLVLLNCAYFKARWSNEFHPENTARREFHLSRDNAVHVPTMHIDWAKGLYFQDETVQILKLDYTDKRFGMYVILPAQGAELNTLISKLTVAGWQSLLSQMSEHGGTFAMPKFRLNYSIELNRSLKMLGMIDAFGETANFSNLLAEGQESLAQFFIGKVIHKTFIDVDEQGTEAAAATAIECWGSMPPEPPPPFDMRVDRPFLYAICDSITGTILFLGAVFDPRD